MNRVNGNERANVLCVCVMWMGGLVVSCFDLVCFLGTCMRSVSTVSLFVLFSLLHSYATAMSTESSTSTAIQSTTVSAVTETTATVASSSSAASSSSGAQQSQVRGLQASSFFRISVLTSELLAGRHFSSSSSCWTSEAFSLLA